MKTALALLSSGVVFSQANDIVNPQIVNMLVQGGVLGLAFLIVLKMDGWLLKVNERRAGELKTWSDERRADRESNAANFKEQTATLAARTENVAAKVDTLKELIATKLDQVKEALQTSCKGGGQK